MGTSLLPSLECDSLLDDFIRLTYVPIEYNEIRTLRTKCTTFLIDHSECNLRPYILKLFELRLRWTIPQGQIKQLRILSTYHLLSEVPPGNFDMMCSVGDK